MDGQNAFEGWAIVEVMGHQTYAGMVTTEYYGGTAFFRVDCPKVPEEPVECGDRPHVREGLPAFTKLVGAGSIYAITPCTEDAVMAARKASIYRPLIPVALPALAGVDPQEGDDF